MNYNTENFSNNLRILRKLRHMTQDQLAQELNTTRSCISNYENGKRQPDSDIIHLIADYFDVSVDYLLGRSSIKMSLRSEEELQELEEISDTLHAITRLDLRNVSTKIKCAVLEYYEFLLNHKKDKAN